MRRHTTTGLLLALSVLAVGTGTAYAGEKSAKVTATLADAPAKPGTQVVVQVKLTPASRTQLYRASVRVELLKPGKLKLGKVLLPAGEKKFDESFNKEVQIYKEVTAIDVPVLVPADHAAGKSTFILRVHFQGCNDRLCFAPDHQDVELTLTSEERAKAPIPALEANPGPTEKPTVESGPAATVATPPDASASSSGDAWVQEAIAGGGLLAVLAAFVAGLLVAFTPCVYPMIPITVALIGGTASGTGGVRRKSTLLLYTLVYVLGIAITYAVLGALAATVGNKMQRIMGDWRLLTVIFTVMTLLALSMFGAFELQMPAWITSKLGRFQGAGSLPMLLVSGIVLGLVASPCVSGPIAFLIVTVGQSGNILFGAASMFAFAWGMSALLIIAGLFPGLLGRPGPWMVWVKIIFGIVMTLAGLYFVRTILPLRFFSLPAVLIVLGVGLGLVMVSRKLSETGKLRNWLGASGSVLLVIAFYLGFGATVASGQMVWLARKTLPVAVASQLCPTSKAVPIHVSWAAYSPEALEAALASGKPVAIDFYADWCTNCDTLEQEVFSRQDVVDELERFVRLRVDASTNAPKGPVDHAEKRFKISGYPTVVFFTSGGKTAGQIIGAVAANDFLAKVRAVR